VIREDVLREVYEWPISVQPDPATKAPRVTLLRRDAK
jgi:hypothetical protein